MPTRATVLKGEFMKVTIGATKVLGVAKYSISGLARRTHETSEFGDDIDVFEFATADGGTISLTDVLYDPTDTTGQVLLDSACLNYSKFGSGDLRFYVNSTSYRTVQSGGSMLVILAYKLDADRSGLGRCGFDVKVSGGAMVLV
jgi:hypothetical protein